MNIKEILEYWKAIVAFIVVISSATYGVIAWASDQKQLIRAERQLIHNEMYQESRVDKKRNQIQDNLKMIKLLESDDDELTLQEQKFLDSLTEENIRLFQEIEEIENLIHTSDIE